MPVPSRLLVALVMMVFFSIVGAWIWAILRLAFRLPVLPPDTPRIVPWGAGSVLAVMLCWWVLGALVANSYAAMVQVRPGVAAPEARWDLTPGEVMTLSAIHNGVTLLLVPLLLAATSGARLRDLASIGPGLGKQALRGMVSYPLLAPVLIGAMWLSVRYWGNTNHPLQVAIAQNLGPGMAVILVLAGVVFAPITEELIFRGVILGWLTRVALGTEDPEEPASGGDGLNEFLAMDRGEHLLETVEVDSVEGVPEAWTPATAEHPFLDPFAPPGAAIATTLGAAPPAPRSRTLRLVAANVAVSLIFAALHGKVWPTPIPIFFLSLGLGFLYQRTGSILASIALHMTFNGLNTLLMFVSISVAPAPNPPVPAPKAILAPEVFYLPPAH